MFGKLFTLAFGGAVGAYGMHHYNESQAKNTQFPNWFKVSADAEFVYNRASATINNIINDKDTEAAVKKVQEKGTEAFEQIKNQIQETTTNLQNDTKYKRIKK